jgi:hypothetical protein
VEIGSGSALDVQRDAQHLGDLDIAQIRENAQREAWGYRAEAEDRRMGANVARMGGNAAATAGRFGAASTALGGASSILLNTYGWPRRA